MAFEGHLPAVEIVRDAAEHINRTVPVSLFHLFLRRFVQAVGSLLPGSGIITQGQKDRPGFLILFLSLQRGSLGHAGLLLQFALAFVVLREQQQRFLRSLPVPLLQQHPRPEQIGFVCFIDGFRLSRNRPQERGRLRQRFRVIAAVRGLQGNLPVALGDHFLRVSVITQQQECFFCTDRVARRQRFPSGQQPQPRGKAEERARAQCYRCGHCDQDPDPGSLAGFLLLVLFLADPLQADRIFPHAPAVQVQLPFPHIDLCFHRFRTEA